MATPLMRPLRTPRFNVRLSSPNSAFNVRKCWVEARVPRPHGRPTRSFSSSESSQEFSQNWRNAGKGLLAASVLGGSAYLLSKQRVESLVPDVEMIGLPPKPVEEYVIEDYTHPFNESSWLFKVYFKTTRFLYLFAVFLPCAGVATLAALTGNEAVRAYTLEVLVETLNKAGCGFMKFGQWLSMRPDLFPADVIAALSKLRDDAPVHTFKHTKNMLKESFGCEFDVMFEEFDESPVASGTVAQVHRGRLREQYAVEANIRDPDGKLVREVAVKVRHPNVVEELFVDVELIYAFCNATKIMAIPFTKEDFLNTLQRQADLKREAFNLIKFADNFKKEVQTGSIRFPAVSSDLLSPTVLLESWASGSSVSKILSNVGAGFQVVAEGFQEAVDDLVGELKDPVLLRKVTAEIHEKKKVLASTLFDMLIKMFLRDNHCHGDLHAGNVMFDTVGDCCTVIDAGMTTSLAPSVRDDFGEFLQALCSADTDRIVERIAGFHMAEYENAKSVDFSSKDPVKRAASRQKFHDSVDAAVNRWVVKQPNGTVTGPDGLPMSLGDLMGEVMFAMQRHGICLRGDVANSLMTMSISEGLIRSLDPTFDMVGRSVPYFVRYRTWS